MAKDWAVITTGLVAELNGAAKTLELLEKSGATEVLKDPDVVKALKPFMAGSTAKGGKGTGGRAKSLASMIKVVLGSGPMDEKGIATALGQKYPDKQFTPGAVKETLKKHTTGDRKRFALDGGKYSVKA